MTVEPSVRRPHRMPGARLRALTGGVIWIVALIVVAPDPFEVEWARALLVLAALVLVPLGLSLARTGGGVSVDRRAFAALDILQMPSAILLGVACLLPQGAAAAALVAPWLATTALSAAIGLRRIWRCGLSSLPELCIDAGLAYLAVGGAWAFSDRLGYRPLDFDAVIVLLTAIHFHYAGFALPVLTGLAARELRGPLALVAGVGVIAAVPAVAVGITATRLGLDPVIEFVAAWAMAVAGVLVAWLYARLAFRPGRPRVVRCLWGVSSLALAGGMVLAALYGSRVYTSWSWLDIPWMRAVHGTVNALGFGLPALVAWMLVTALRNTAPS